jgi:hypothetical protein
MIGEKYLEKLDYRLVAVLLVIAILLAFVYNFFISINIFTALIAMLIAVFGSYFIFMSFFEEEKPVKLNEGENMILRTLDRGYLLYPKKLGGFMGKKSHRDLDIYLTDRRILAREPSGEFILDKALNSIEDIIPGKRLMSRYLRARYSENGKDKDVLLFVGDIDLWMEKLNELGVVKKGRFDEISKTKENDSKKLKKR